MRQQRVWMPLPQVADADRREAAHEHLGLSANVCGRSLQLVVEIAQEGKGEPLSRLARNNPATKPLGHAALRGPAPGCSIGLTLIRIFNPSRFIQSIYLLSVFSSS